MKYNSVILVQHLDGYRVAYVEDIRELEWELVDPNYPDQYEQVEEIKVELLKKHFSDSLVFKDKNDAWHCAVLMFRKLTNNGIKLSKESIRFLKGCENREFP